MIVVQRAVAMDTFPANELVRLVLHDEKLVLCARTAIIYIPCYVFTHISWPARRDASSKLERLSNTRHTRHTPSFVVCGNVAVPTNLGKIASLVARCSALAASHSPDNTPWFRYQTLRLHFSQHITAPLFADGSIPRLSKPWRHTLT